MKAMRITLLAVVASSVLLAGCIFSPEEGDPPKNDVNDDLPFAGSPEQLMLNFKQVYEDRNYDGYLTVMNEDFRIFLKQETIQEFGLPRDFFEYAEEIQITEKMFSGNPPSPEVGAITDITFKTMQQITAWDETENIDFAGYVESEYEVRFEIMQETPDGSQKQLNIQGRIKFFLTSEEVEHQGRPRQLYTMVGQIDETNVGGT